MKPLYIIIEVGFEGDLTTHGYFKEYQGAIDKLEHMAEAAELDGPEGDEVDNHADEGYYLIDRGDDSASFTIVECHQG